MERKEWRKILSRPRREEGRWERGKRARLKRKQGLG